VRKFQVLNQFKNIDFFDYFLIITQNITKISEKASIKIPSRVDYLSFDVCYVFLIEKVITEKNIIVKSMHSSLCSEFKKYEYNNSAGGVDYRFGWVISLEGVVSSLMLI